MKYHAIAHAILFSSISVTAMATDETQPVEVIDVYGDYSQLSLDQIAQSATIISAQGVQQRHVNHLDGVLNMAPNVNFSSGASRGKYIQIRGIGERSQFSEPLNPSVGLVLDGMAVSGLGDIATLLVVAQVDILRGTQSTVFGTSAIAGVVNLVYNVPTAAPSGSVSVKSATTNTRA